jgi:hypothetical protein
MRALSVEFGLIALGAALLVGGGATIYSGVVKQTPVSGVVGPPVAASSNVPSPYTSLKPNSKGAHIAAANSQPPRYVELNCRNKLRTRGVYPSDTAACIDIDEVIKTLGTGVYRFNRPQIAYVEEPFRFVLMLETAGGQDKTGPFQGTAGEIVERAAPVAQHLQAMLHGGPDFRVDPADAQVRTVTSSEPLVWEWTVVPLREGKKTLAIDVSADLILGTAKEHVQLRTLYESIQINVGFIRLFVSAFAGIWEYALGLATMMIAVLGVYHYWPLKERRASARFKGKQPPPPVELVAHHHHSASPSSPPS